VRESPHEPAERHFLGVLALDGLGLSRVSTAATPTAALDLRQPVGVLRGLKGECLLAAFLRPGVGRGVLEALRPTLGAVRGLEAELDDGLRRASILGGKLALELHLADGELGGGSSGEAHSGYPHSLATARASRANSTALSSSRAAKGSSGFCSASAFARSRVSMAAMSIRSSRSGLTKPPAWSGGRGW